MALTTYIILDRVQVIDATREGVELAPIVDGRQPTEEDFVEIEAPVSFEADGDRIKAECRGDSAAVYDTGFSEERGEWYCSCPARSKCAHLVALQLVTVRNRKEE